MENQIEFIDNESQSIPMEIETKKRSRIASTHRDVDSNQIRMNCGIENINTAMEKLEQTIHQCFLTEGIQHTITKEQALSTLNKVSLEIIKATTKTLLQEERITALLQQIVALQNSKGHQINALTYLEAARIGEKAKAIGDGRVLPPIQTVENHQHFPSEIIIIVKAKVKGDIPSKKSQEEFHDSLRTTVGIAVANEITAVRVTKYGGYLIIFRDSESRDKAARIMEDSLIPSELMNVPNKKIAKMLCRDIPEDVTHEEILHDLYGKHNPFLMNIPPNLRQLNIIDSKICWIFQLSSPEAAAIFAQGSKVRFGFGREIKLEEFIPLQQCFRCCSFGHNANSCQSTIQRCRLCAAKGHSGRSCIHKDNKQKWKCYNCNNMNEQRGMNLPVDHAAAQLHKCSVAEQERQRKKEQLTAIGVFTINRSKSLSSLKQSGIMKNRTTHRNIGTTNDNHVSFTKAVNVTSSSILTSSSSSSSTTSKQPQITSNKKTEIPIINSANSLSSSSFSSNAFLSSSSFLSSASFISSSAFSGKSLVSRNSRGRPKNKSIDETITWENENNNINVRPKGQKSVKSKNNESNDNEENHKTIEEKHNENDVHTGDGWTPVTRGRGGRGRGKGRGGGAYDRGVASGSSSLVGKSLDKQQASEASDSEMHMQ